jgi:hypothetical protein
MQRSFKYRAAVLTGVHADRLRDAYPIHLASVRGRIMNQVEPKALTCFGDVMAAIASRLEESQEEH